FVYTASLRHRYWRLPRPPSLPTLFTRPPPPEIYTLSLHDALPILRNAPRGALHRQGPGSGRRDVRTVPHRTVPAGQGDRRPRRGDRKSTRLNSSHVKISYAVFCLKKKKIQAVKKNSGGTEEHTSER